MPRRKQQAPRRAAGTRAAFPGRSLLLSLSSVSFITVLQRAEPVRLRRAPRLPRCPRSHAACRGFCRATLGLEAQHCGVGGILFYFSPRGGGGGGAGEPFPYFGTHFDLFLTLPSPVSVLGGNTWWKPGGCVQAHAVCTRMIGVSPGAGERR